MNSIYRVIWSRVKQAYLAVAEICRAHGNTLSLRKARRAAVIALSCLCSLPAWAASGGAIASGAGSIDQTGAATTITQTSQRMTINWQDFNIGAGQSVNFVQPNSAAIALNRVLGAGVTDISGSLRANGQVFIINPNGVVFGAGAQVNVGGLVATSLQLSDNDFNAGNYRFGKQGTAGSIVNQGALSAADGGYIALLAPEVRNEGVVSARLGSVLFAAADRVTLSLDRSSLIGYTLDQGSLNALVENRNLVQADGGKVFFTAKAADEFARAVVNNSGVIEARTINDQNGTIQLLADMQVGEVQHSGTLDASAPDGGDGGFVETSAAHVNVTDGARVNTGAPFGQTGSWLIDPSDYTVAASGGDISGAALSSNLASSNITLQTSAAGSGNGDLFINDEVSWGANTILTLQAHRNIQINQNITATGVSAGLVLNPGSSGDYAISKGATVTLSGSNASLTIAGNAYTLIHNIDQLQNIKTSLNGRYALGNEINASATTNWNSGAGFAPLGSTATSFTGTLIGLNHTVDGLVINRPDVSYVGLFGSIGAAGVVRDLGLTNVNVVGMSDVGALAGENQGAISNSYAVGSVMGMGCINCRNAGGLVGSNSGSIKNSYAAGSVVSDLDNTGGLVGRNMASGVISDSYATNSVLVHDGLQRSPLNNSYLKFLYDGNVGGLVGLNFGKISRSYATGSVTAVTINVGGLVGGAFDGMISESYATGDVLGDMGVGGLVGWNCGCDWSLHSNYEGGNPTIDNSYATGSVTSSGSKQFLPPGTGFLGTGGLVGGNGGAIRNSYATGRVTALANDSRDRAGGLVGMDQRAFRSRMPGTYDASGVTDSFWNADTSGMSVSAGGVGKTTAEMQTQSTFASWDFGSPLWRMPKSAAPCLAFECALTTVYVKPVSGSSVYGDAPNIAYTLVDANGRLVTLKSASVDGASSYSGTPSATDNVGNYSLQYSNGLSLSGSYADFYALAAWTSSPVQWSVTPRPVSITVSKVYDGNAMFSQDFVLENIFVLGNILEKDKNQVWLVMLYYGASVASKNVGDYHAFVSTTGGIALHGSNYTLTGSAVSAHITPADLVLSTSNIAKTYDGGTSASGLARVVGGSLFGGDSVSGGSFAFADSNAGSDKTVHVSGVTVADGNGGKNYNVTYQDNTHSTINKANLSVIANDDQRAYSGVPYQGGNGVRYEGFVHGETDAVLQGDLTYGGSAQGAVNAGDYAISPLGLQAANYQINYQDGNLKIDAAAATIPGNLKSDAVVATVPPGVTPKPDTLATVLEAPDKAVSTSLASSIALLEVMPPAAGQRNDAECADNAGSNAGKKATSARISVTQCGIRLPQVQYQLIR